jgi:hypothetical protein
MVNDEAQIFTIEGVAAAFLMLATAYIILNSTSLLTPGDTHINDMQLQQLGNDVLRLMDTPLAYNTSAETMYGKKMSNLELYVLYRDNLSFENEFFNYTGFNDTSVPPLHMEANISYSNGPIMPFLSSTVPKTNREHSVTVTKWVNLDDQVTLLEVHLWRD